MNKMLVASALSLALMSGTALAQNSGGLNVGVGVGVDAGVNSSTGSGSLGVDAKSFVPGTTKGTVGVLRATSTGDQYLLGAVTVRVGQAPASLTQTIP